MTSATPTAPTRTTVRVLPPEEWPRLEGLPFASRYGLPDPAFAQILVAEDDGGTIVGVWAALTTVHLDGLWIAPDYRKTSRVAAQLLRTMKALLRRLGVVHSFTLVAHDTPEVLTLALKAGFTRLPMDTLFLDLTEAPCPP